MKIRSAGPGDIQIILDLIRDQFSGRVCHQLSFVNGRFNDHRFTYYYYLSVYAEIYC